MSTRFFWSLLPVPLPRKHSIPFSAQLISTLHSLLKAYLLRCSHFKDSCQQLQTFQAPRQLHKGTGKRLKKKRLCDRTAKAEAVWFQCLYFRLYSFLKRPADDTVHSFCLQATPILWPPHSFMVMAHVHVCVCWGWAGELPPRCMFSVHNCQDPSQGLRRTSNSEYNSVATENFFLCKY